MGTKNNNRRAFLRRLAKDTTANTLAIAAASLMPLLIMVGGGIDASRYYMAEARLQAACDSGALAARHSMGSDGFTKDDQETGEKFFDQNYQEGMFGLEELEREFTESADGEVEGAASGTLPSTIMAAFGYEEFGIAVTCEADINIANTDIMLVLDTTGSMAYNADNTVYNGTDSKINELRKSTLSLYDAIEGNSSPNARIRWGVVPYSNQVNVGHLLKADWMKASHTYQSREADWVSTFYEDETYEYTRTGGAYNWKYIGKETDVISGVSQSECVTQRTNEFDIYNSSDPAGWTLVKETGDPTVNEYTGVVTYEYHWQRTGSYNAASSTCTYSYQFYLYDAESTIMYYPAGATYVEFQWVYKPLTFDVSNVFETGSLTAPTGWEGADETHTWNGCIEEASTVQTTDYEPIPEDAYDMMIDLVPSKESEKWAPMLTSLMKPRYRDNTSQYSSGNWVFDEMTSQEDKSAWWAVCPPKARKLEEITERQILDDYLKEENGFVADGATFHDIGMIWGARLLSPNGIYAADNETAPNGDAISRHIIFLTDGVMYGNNAVYSMHGYEWWDRRVTTDGAIATNTAIREDRFQAICRSVRNKNVSIWVVAFGTTLTQNLIDCATPGRAYHAADGEELEEAFLEIAGQISALRLTE